MTDESGLSLQEANGSSLEGEASAASKPEGYKFCHFPQLDGFRGLAIVFVIFGHVVKYSGKGKTLYDIGQHFAATGVFLFFVLSGFLITGLLQKERASKGAIDLRRFYLRRALRLGPALLLFLSILTLLKLLGLTPGLPGYEIAACLLYARNFFGRTLTTSQIWSLSLEEKFYLCWP